MKRILCFGDSLTHGTKPVAYGEPPQRYNVTERWTGILQSKLAQSIVIVEEGLPSRTIDLDDPRPNKEGRNGSVYLWPCIGSHIPLDAVVVWLGTNDTKDIFDKSPEQISDSLKQLLIKLKGQLQQSSPGCKVIVMSPPQINSDSEGAKQWYGNATPKLAALPSLYEQVTKELGLEFIDLYLELGEPNTLDGIHLSLEQNKRVAEKLNEKLVEIGIVL